MRSSSKKPRLRSKGGGGLSQPRFPSDKSVEVVVTLRAYRDQAAIVGPNPRPGFSINGQVGDNHQDAVVAVAEVLNQFRHGFTEGGVLEYAEAFGETLNDLMAKHCQRECKNQLSSDRRRVDRTICFSGLRIIVQDWPQRSRCLLSDLRYMLIDAGVRGCMRLVMRLSHTGMHWLAMPDHKPARRDPAEEKRRSVKGDRRELPGRAPAGSPPHPQGTQEKGTEEHDNSDKQQVQQALHDHAHDTQRDRHDHQ
jgi:hypothetical protein